MGAFHRICQYLSAIKSELFGVGGEDCIVQLLSEGEQLLWKRQTAPDRAHSLQVAQTADRLQRASMKGLSAEDRRILLKAALLHDIGRGEFGSSFAKSLAVLLRLWNNDKFRSVADGAALKRLGRTRSGSGKGAGNTASGEKSGTDNKKDARRRPEYIDGENTESYTASLMYHYYYHPEIGAELLLDLYRQGSRAASGEQERIAWLVEHHRDDTAGGDCLLGFLIEADRQN